MKLASFALTAAAAATVALAQPHHHAHRHAHQHRQREVTKTTYATGPTAYVYLLDGQEITQEKVCAGLEDNELKFVDGQDPGVCSSSAAAATPTTSSIPSTTAAPTTTAEPSTTSDSPTTTTTSAAAASDSGAAEFFQHRTSSASASGWGSASETGSSSSAAASASASSTGSSSISGGTGLTAAFPDGELSCDTFPSDYGAVALDYLGMGGWSGLQAVTIVGNLVNHIVTGVSGQSCTEGMMCSYACPPGYQKSQWPSTQGATGQSVGGLSCSGGKLHLTNPSLSTSLCIPGVGGVQATNKAGGVVSICRTDYPGTESETIPVELQPGSTEELAVPDASTYYTWQGKSTSAQYYLNPIGYGPSDACKWGSAGTPLGNFAPINFGVGAKGGVTWLSIFQNSPTTSAQYEGTVEIQGNLSGSCKYQNGQYCSATGCNSNGCTVSVISGTATYVISD
ncbi:Beta-glucosidase (SUN) [Exophiala dermatitidis]|uniref:SUN domain-containing protein (Uth1) n=2 Tax=Exophiala dermatitidis TaxID=5970 RepID=H6BT08_EXODN|nr:SUN domain-containing protein (Uth1) [Exophiala dermatitidis NIH/UT8656]KAJ4519030.1 Beta-glucosidase (SUN) [Exophiala dermatitidis]EHY53457.1 SUN domain-containing protein (Uth1) [Exophiala dermatitidis NIH/UT8656]KAJ4522374.1 Beta-glucosidase (SUN) [Exophiala dermatitidis]KAJ4529699.1 Beta-glucosidase (SUN) [Exophiala dermatitidis]KAJ4543137.1 Beta-glucosidase (SUN) [Exophiala dermatitidis]